MQIDDEKFKKLKESTRELYYSTESVYCPFFGEQVFFTSDGYQHLFHKGQRNERLRTKEDQYVRMKLFKLVPKLLRESKIVQEHQVKKTFVPVVHNHRDEQVLRDVNYWGFLGIIDGRRIKVVVRKIGNGKLCYRSVVPKWKYGNQILNYVRDLDNE